MLVFSLTAIIQVFVLPLVNDATGSLYIAGLDQSNCYGTGLWAGLLVSNILKNNLIIKNNDPLDLLSQKKIVENLLPLVFKHMCTYFPYFSFQLVITGSLGIRAAVYKSVTTVSGSVTITCINASHLREVKLMFSVVGVHREEPPVQSHGNGLVPFSVQGPK